MTSSQRRPIIALIVTILVASTLLYIANRIRINNPPVIVTTLTDGTYCFTMDQAATSSVPYEVHEKMTLTVAGTTVTGKKEGIQQGPDMGNGYTGTITGTIKDTQLDVVYSYTVEGSANKEAEMYVIENGNLIKNVYQLIEQGGMLVPDTTKELVKMTTYVATPCTPVVPQGKLKPEAITNTEQGMIGVWKSNSDAKNTIVYAADGTYQNFYDDELADKGTWQIITALTGTSYDDGKSDGIYLHEISITNGDELYHSVDLNDNNLNLTYVARGNTNSYTRVK